jgi:hypothetical protein
MEWVVYLKYTTDKRISMCTKKNLRSSLMMAGYCRNMQEPVYRIEEWYKSVHSVGHFY